MNYNRNADLNRLSQMYLAQRAVRQGFKYAKRRSGSAKSCPDCRRSDGEMLDIQDVANGYADHLYGKCTFVFY